MIDNISGRVGGQSFINANGSTYLKNIGNVSKTPTVKQSAQRYKTANLMQTWRTLTTVQVNSWKSQVGKYTYVNRVGEVQDYNAFQIFMLLNQGRLSINESLILTGVSNSTLVDPLASITDATAFSLEITSLVSTSTQTYVLWCTPPLSKGQTQVKSLLRKVSVISDADLFAGYVFSADYLNVFPQLTSNQNIGYWLQPYVTASGQKETDIQTDIFTTT